MPTRSLKACEKVQGEFETLATRRGSSKLGVLFSILRGNRDLFSAEQMLPTWKGAGCQACSNKVAAEPVENTLDVSDHSECTPQCYIFLEKFLGSPLHPEPLGFLDLYSSSSEIRV